MHPEIARQMVAEHHKDVTALSGPGQPRPARRAGGIPRWRVSCSWMASSADARGGRAWLIIIRAHRTIRPTA